MLPSNYIHNNDNNDNDKNNKKLILPEWPFDYSSFPHYLVLLLFSRVGLHNTNCVICIITITIGVINIVTIIIGVINIIIFTLTALVVISFSEWPSTSVATLHSTFTTVHISRMFLFKPFVICLCCQIKRFSLDNIFEVNTV